jgi:hypothetical protein
MSHAWLDDEYSKRAHAAWRGVDGPDVAASGRRSTSTIGSPGHAVVMKRGPALRQGMPPHVAGACDGGAGALAQLPAGVQEGSAMLAYNSLNIDGLLQEFWSP